MARCPCCGAIIYHTQTLKFIGVADVVGHTTLEDFHREGIEWHAHDSDKERIECPNCGAYIPVWQGENKAEIGRKCE